MTPLDALIAIACPSLAAWEPDPRWPFGEPPTFDECFPDFPAWAMQRIEAMGTRPANDGATPVPLPALAPSMARPTPKAPPAKPVRQPYRPPPERVQSADPMTRAAVRRDLRDRGLHLVKR